MKMHICTSKDCPERDAESAGILQNGFKTFDGQPLFSSKHTGTMGSLMRDERTIGEILLAKKKPKLFIKLLKLIRP